MQSDFRDWSEVRVFLAVVRAGSTLAASRTLGMAQPTVARRIEALEHALGLVLFERDTRGFRPTDEAQALIAEAQTLETAARDFGDKARRLIEGKSRIIRFTAYNDAFNNRLAGVVQAFVSTRGDVQFEFLASDDYLDLAAGEADVALRTGNYTGEPTLICRKIRDMGISLFASRGYAAKHPLPATEAEFAGHAFMVHEGRLAANEFNRWLLARIDPDQIAMVCDHPKALETAVLMGMGIGPMPTAFGRAHDTVVKCMELPPEAAVSVWLLVNPTAWRRPEVKAFTAFFVPRYRALFRDG